MLPCVLLGQTLLEKAGFLIWAKDCMSECSFMCAAGMSSYLILLALSGMLVSTALTGRRVRTRQLTLHTTFALVLPAYSHHAAHTNAGIVSPSAA